MSKLTRIKQFWRRTQFLAAYEAASRSDNDYERMGASKFALEIVDTLDPWPDSAEPKERAIGNLHGFLGNAYNELGESDPLHFPPLALQESLKAVEHLTKSDGIHWARAMTTLAIAYANTSNENHDNLGRAIEAAEAALEVIDRDQHREEWLVATVNLAAFYKNYNRDSMTANIEESIRLYEAVYEEVSESGPPYRQARALIGLADAHMERRIFSKEENIERAIEKLEEALKLIDPETSPRAWTTAHGSLSVAYSERIKGPKDENLRRAIASNDECIRVLQQNGLKERWARAQMVRSNLLEDCHDRDRVTILQEAIEAAQNALGVFTADKYPDDHAEILRTIDYLRSLQHDDSRSGVLEGIIRKHEETLSSESAELSSDERATLLVRLGNTYAERVESDRAENMERSIERLQQAVNLYDQHERPLQWGAAVLNLAQSYHERTKGLQADNIEKTIALCENAIVVVSSLSDPDEHSAILETLAEAFCRRVRGDHRENLERAIQIFDAAHRRRDRQNNPEAWLRLEQKLLQAERILDRVTDYEFSKTKTRLTAEQYLAGLQASADMVSAKDHPRTWMAAQMFLADSYTQVTPTGVEISDVLPFVDAVCANCRKAVLIYESMLPVARRLGDQDQQALLHQRIGAAYSLMHMFTETQARVSEDPVEKDRYVAQARGYFDFAIAAFRAALEINSLERSPREHLKSAIYLARLHAEEGQWVAADEQFVSAARAADKLMGDIEISESDMREALDELHVIATFAPFVSLMLDAPARAIELAETSRARILAKALTLQSLPLAKEQRDELHDKQRQLNIKERRLLSPRLFDRMTPLEESIRLRRQIKSLVESTNLTDHFSGFTISALESLVSDGSVVVIPVLRNAVGKMIVCSGRNGKTETCVVECPEVKALHSIFKSRNSETDGTWKDQYRKLLERGVPDVLGEAFAIPLVEALDSLGVRPGAHLDILPQGPLGILPLGLARDERSGQILLNQYELSLSPSLTTLYHARKRAEIVPSSIVALANPTRNLDYAEPEAHLLRNWFQDEKAEYKVGKAVTPGEILAALPEKDVWHFATHGGFDASAPLKSRLWLEEDKLGRHLTLEMIFETRGLGTPRLVVLSACETGLYDLTSYPFEFTGLPSGFMHAGAAGVIATLWPVNDLSTALLMGKFYEGYMGGGLTPSAALRAAQLWLRDATVPDLRHALESWGKSGRVSSIENMIAAFDLRVSERESSRDFALGDSFANISSNNSPYSSPLYWGGFVHYGV